MNQLTPDLRELSVASCWATIGLRGDKSCPQLTVYAHCRNCPAYADIAATLLDRPTIDEIWDYQSDSQADDPAIGKTNDRSALIFRLGNEWLGLEMRVLDEVIELRHVHRLPHRSNPVLLGLVNVRGELVVCVSLDQLLGIEAENPEEGRSQRLLILRSASGLLAVPVDEVQHTHSFQTTDLIAPPATISRSAGSYTTDLLHWRGRNVAIIDDSRMIEAFERCLH